MNKPPVRQVSQKINRKNFGSKFMEQQNLRTWVDHFFSPDGPLAEAMPRYEERKEQNIFAQNIAEAIENNEPLIAEAGTGTGKSLGYLAPAIGSGLKVVVSTGTKNLQEQLLNKDLKLLENALGRKVEYQLMKGRTNYLCHFRTDEWTRQLNLNLDQTELKSILDWRETTPDGDRANLSSLPDDAPIWRNLSANSEQCLGQRCIDYERCFVTQMRRQAQNVDLIVVNHHLYFADLALRSRLGDDVGLLPGHDIIIFDEAHDLDDVAAQHFGYTVSEKRFSELFNEIRKYATSKPALAQEIELALSGLEQDIKKIFDLLPFNKMRKRLEDSALNESVFKYHDRADEQLNLIESHLAHIGTDESMRLLERTALIAAELCFILKRSFRRSQGTEAELEKQLGLQHSIQGDLFSNNLAPETEETLSNIPFVRYTESPSDGQRIVSARPIEAGPFLQNVLKERTTIFVSATLRVGGNFDFFRQRVGLPECSEVAVDSPFDYQTNARLYIPGEFPLPQSPDFFQAASDEALALIEASKGGTFVLCTSYRMLNELSRAIVRQTQKPVWVQGKGPKHLLLEEFIECGSGILLGTMSFWQGVDVPGEALELVIIDKLPFASPDDPLVAARQDYLTGQGLSAFKLFQIPQAALLLRQGFGRLLRRQTDRGAVAIFDRRIQTKGYGKTFLRSLPDCPILSERDDIVAFLQEQKD